MKNLELFESLEENQLADINGGHICDLIDTFLDYVDGWLR